MTSDDLVRRRARQLAAQAAASGDQVSWFETLYAEARAGRAVVPWDDGQPNPHLTDWAKTAAERGIVGPGRRVLVQALYGEARTAAIRALPGLVAPGGTMLVIARATDDQDPVRDPAMMPWPLTERELQAMAGNTLSVRSVEKFLDDEDPPKLRWRAEFTRD